jgi:hypothetical protein
MGEFKMKTLKQRLDSMNKRQPLKKPDVRHLPGKGSTVRISIDGKQVWFYTTISLRFKDYPGKKVVDILKKNGFKWDGDSWHKFCDLGVDDLMKQMITANCEA